MFLPGTLLRVEDCIANRHSKIQPGALIYFSYPTILVSVPPRSPRWASKTPEPFIAVTSRTRKALYAHTVVVGSDGIETKQVLLWNKKDFSAQMKEDSGARMVRCQRPVVTVTPVYDLEVLSTNRHHMAASIYSIIKATVNIRKNNEMLFRRILVTAHKNLSILKPKNPKGTNIPHKDLAMENVLQRLDKRTLKEFVKATAEDVKYTDFVKALLDYTKRKYAETYLLYYHNVMLVLKSGYSGLSEDNYSVFDRVHLERIYGALKDFMEEEKDFMEEEPEEKPLQIRRKQESRQTDICYNLITFHLAMNEK